MASKSSEKQLAAVLGMSVKQYRGLLANVGISTPETTAKPTEKGENHGNVAEEKSTYYGTGYPFQNGSNYTNMWFTPIFNGVFNGEKTQGALGNPLNLLPDFRALRYRAYEAYLTNDTIKTVADKYFNWIVGGGLKMQAEPYLKILQLEKIEEDFPAFIDNVEQYFELWARSPRSDFSGMGNLHINARKQYKTKFLGGDALVICRLDDDLNVTVQIIDGQHINNPLDSKMIQDAKTKGNIIMQGIEIDSTGRHVAFYVNKQLLDSTLVTGIVPTTFEYVRIQAVGDETGCLMAWMAYGFKLRIDHQRALTSLAPVLEKVQKLDRFTEATVAGAEERAKIYLTVEHGKSSDGENPLLSTIKNSIGTPTAPNVYANGALAAKEIAVSEERSVYNMPIDSQLKAISSTQEINYEPFYKAVFNQISASMNVPPEVAIQQYNSNYSASRAAINSWGFIIDIERTDLIQDFYQPIYNLWLYVHILKNKVSAAGYIKAKNKRNFDVVESYSAAKFTGPKMPHIDPLKEINAIRTALGDDSTALITYEQATDAWDGGDWETNAAKISAEKKEIESLGLNPPPPTVAPGSQGQGPLVKPKPLET